MHIRFRPKLWSTLVVIAGCASISIDQPKDQSTNVRMPEPIRVSQKGFVDFRDPYLDNFNLSSYNGSHWQYVPQSTLYYVAPGSHLLSVPAKDGKWGTDISQSSTFTVTACPLCYSCPAGNVHPMTGQCCDNAVCDRWVYGNFGQYFYSSAKCQQFTFPSTSPRSWYEFDCINSIIDVVRGAAAGSPQMIAVRFTPRETGALRHVQAPIGLRSGTNSLLVWVTTDANNVPGQVLDSLTLNTVRPQPSNPLSAQPPVDAPAHIFFTGNTQLSAQTRYWLVLGPGAATTEIWWNLSLEDFSLPADPTYLVNTTNSNVAGPWTKKTPTLADLRPAFEIDLR